MKILIIEDERQLSDNIKNYLSAQKYLCEQAFNYNEARMKVGVYAYDCILLDLMLPGGDGLDILRFIRQRNNQAGVIIISAKGSLDDRIKGLEIGADDYVYALIRRKNFTANNKVSSNGITIDLLEKSARVGDTTLQLTPTEYELLLFFITNRNRVVSKEAIAEHLSGEMADLLDNFDFIYSHIKNLKAKMAKAHVVDCIKTIYGTGYKWTE